jgi:hypothetical protein
MRAHRILSNKHNCQGFALVIALSLMAFTLLLLVSITALTRVETRSAEISLATTEARQNARLGMQVALGQLQRYAGADQRITAPATTVYPQKDVTSGAGSLYDDDTYGYRSHASTSSSRSYLTNVETYLTPKERGDWDVALQDYWGNNDYNPHWTAVYDTSLRVDRASDPTDTPDDLDPEIFEQNDPDKVGSGDTRFGEPKRDQLPIWLVSGNEQLNFDPRITTSYPTNYQTPDTALAEPGSDPANPTIWLVGENSATLPADSSDGLDGRVKVKTVEIIKTANSTSGHYAYWVSDESTKANFSIQAEDPDSLSTTEYRNYLQVPQRIGWERMEGFSDANLDPHDPIFSKVLNKNQIELLDTSFEDDPNSTRGPVPKNFHHITASSKSLFTDTALGGLKKDLTQYLEDGSGLSDNDPIAAPSRYASNDPRFRAWGGTNTGFPNTGTAAEDGIPKWGQLRDWYDNAASQTGGSLTPDADAGIGPVLTYLMFNGGWSYEPSTQKIRWHWMPCLVLWNPYDAALSSATYDIELEFTPALWKGYVCKPNPTLAELQAQAGANWLPDPDPATDANGDGDINNDWLFTDTTGTQQVRLNPSNPDAINLPAGIGPFVEDSDITDGVTDAFGRLFYRLESADPANIHLSHWRNSSGQNFGPLGQHVAATRLVPHDDTGNPSKQRPINKTMLLRVSANFGAGEAKVFTIGNTQQWINGNAITLINDFDPDFPGDLWFDFMEIVNGPASAEASNLRWNFTELAGAGFASPGVKISLGGKTLFEANRFGGLEGNDAWSAALGRSYGEVTDYRTFSEDDEDGDGIVNRIETGPKFISRWRPLYNFTNFDQHFKTQSGSETDASNWAYGVTWVQPLTGNGGDRADQVHNYNAVFSRFNFASSYNDWHPLVEEIRSRHVRSNYNYLGNKEMLTQLLPFRDKDDGDLGGASEVKWDDNQANGSAGYALVTYKNVDGDYTGLNQVSIRAARRAQSEILSLGQLQQINLSRYFWQPAFPIGNSWAAPYTDREAIAGIHSREVGTAQDPSTLNQNIRSIYKPVAGYRPNNADLGTVTLSSSNGESYYNIKTPGNTMMDLSYLLNENLWDQYFLSTITSTPDLNEPLPNNRIRYSENATTASSADLTDFNTASAYLENVGALNVNSTSVEAWKAVFTAFRDLKLGDNPDETVPIARSLNPVEDSIQLEFDKSLTASIDDDAIGALSSNKDYTKVLSGFRYLTDGMIQTLSERIVDEVRLRGPFYSLADFVNRRLVAPSGSGTPGSDWFQARTSGSVDGDLYIDFMNPSYDPFIGLQGLSGPLQRAIQVSGINGGINHPLLGLDGTGTANKEDMIYTPRIRLGAGPANAAYVGGQSWGGGDAIGGVSSNSRDKHTQEPTLRSHLDTEHIAGAPAGEAGQLFDGTPGFITQGDLLAMLGPALTARGDTFMIRSYGDSISPVTGNVVGKAWLETIVQRTVAPVTPLGVTAPDKFTPSDRFGRRFEIVSMRWLTEDEI